MTPSNRCLTKLLIMVLCAVGAGRAYSAGSAEQTVPIDIAPQRLSEALTELGKQTGLQLVLYSVVARQPVTTRLVGSFTPKAALERLLANTGLRYEYLDAQTVAILSESQESPSARVRGRDDGAEALQLARADGADTGEGAGTSQQGAEKQEPEGAAATAENSAQEIVVTAQKRQERQQDVPIPMSVLSPTSLINNNLVSFRDYFNAVPGVSLRSSTGGVPVVIIRGLSVGGFSNPGTGFVIDDAPYGTSTALGGGFQLIDIDPADLERVEVLRGPQGTLYGANSLGGLVKFVTIEPSLDQLSGRITGSVQSVENSEELGHAFRGSFNAPLSDTLAMRLSGFARNDAGFIDDTVHNLDAINGGNSYGGRLGLLWRPSDALAVNFSALYQDLNSTGDEVDAGDDARDLEFSHYVPTYFASSREVMFLTASIDADIGDSQLTAITAYTDSSQDMRNSGVAFAAFAAPFGGDLAPYQQLAESTKFSQEVRALVPLGSHFEWLIGGFYTKEETDHLELLTAADLQSGALVAPEGNIFNSYYPSEYEELAAFTDLTVRFTDTFDVQVGARFSQIDQTLANRISGVITAAAGGPPISTAPVSADDDPVTYLIAPRLKLSSGMMIYARLASGYRPGGPNYNVATTGGPESVKADTTENYEIGIKGDLLEGALSIDASVYHIDWEDIQVTLIDPVTGRSYVDNGGTAQVQGVELSIQARPVTGLTLAGWVAYSDATLESIPTGSSLPADPGDQLPYSSRYTGNASVNYEFPLFQSSTGHVGAAVRYVGSKELGFTAAATGRIELPSFTQVDLQAGLIQSDGWQFNVFLNNVTDERGIIDQANFGSEKTIIRPRTIGFSISADF